MSSRVRASTGRSSTLRLTAGPRNCSISTALDVFVGSNKNATRESLGIVSLSSSNRLPARSGAREVKPVTLPPGRARLSTSPVDTGSEVPTKTIGTVLICFAASTPPLQTTTSTPSRTISSAIALARSDLPSADRRSMAIFFPSIKPSSRRPSRRAISRSDVCPAGPWLTRTNRGIFFDCCASTTAPQITIPKAITENHNHFRFWIADFGLSERHSKGMRSSVCSLGF